MYFHFHRKRKVAGIKLIICLHLEASLYLLKVQEMRNSISERKL